MFGKNAYSPKWWIDGDLAWYEVKKYLIRNKSKILDGMGIGCIRVNTPAISLSPCRQVDSHLVLGPSHRSCKPLMGRSGNYPKRNVVFQPSFFKGYVHLQGCRTFPPQRLRVNLRRSQINHALSVWEVEFLAVCAKTPPPSIQKRAIVESVE